MRRKRDGMDGVWALLCLFTRATSPQLTVAVVVKMAVGRRRGMNVLYNVRYDKIVSIRSLFFYKEFYARILVSALFWM